MSRTWLGKNMCLKSRGSKNETHSYDAPVCSLSVFFFLTNSPWQKIVLRPLAFAGISKQTLFRVQYFSATTCQNKMNIMNISWWKMPGTCIARRRQTMKTTQTPFGNFPIPDLEHLTITTPTLYIVAPRTLAPLYHCAFYIAPLNPLHRTVVTCCTTPLHRTSFKKKNIAKKEKNIAKSLNFAMFFCFFAMFFFENWYGAEVRWCSATGQWVRLDGAWVQFTEYTGATSWYSGATRGYIATYWLRTVHTFAGRLPYLSQVCRKNHCLKPNSRKFKLVHFGLEAFSTRQKQ